MIGIKSSPLQPRLLHQLPNGLCVYRMVLKDVYGSRLAFGGTDRVFTDANRIRYGYCPGKDREHLSQQYNAFLHGVTQYCRYLSKVSTCSRLVADSNLPVIDVDEEVEA